MKVSRYWLWGIGGLIIAAISFWGGYLVAKNTQLALRSPFSSQPPAKELPLLAYTIPALQKRSYVARTISLNKVIAEQQEYRSYLFSFDPLGRKMSGQLNIPKVVTPNTPVIVMVRGFVPPAIFSTGVGTKNAAAAFAKAGFITIAPDFFGYGQSDPEPSDTWQARFEKPIVVVELIKTIREHGIPVPPGDNPNATVSYQTDHIGLWGHSNGGQISLSTLAIMKEPIPTSLWAPVSVPFPYSLLFFTDEDADEGKSARSWIAQFEKDYDARQFSFTNYLQDLAGPLQLHHGTNDDAALKTWSDEFIEKLKKENIRRAKVGKDTTPSNEESGQLLEPIEYHYYQYPGADHNLQPMENWNTVVERDIDFYKEKLK